jgi:hypothetical protein
MDLPRRRPDRLAGVLAGDAGLGAQPAELGAKQHPANRWPTAQLLLGHAGLTSL